jgi:hypothetical protein
MDQSDHGRTQAPTQFPGEEEENVNNSLLGNSNSRQPMSDDVLLGEEDGGSSSQVTTQLLGDAELLENHSSMKILGIQSQRSGSMPSPWEWRAFSDKAQTQGWQRKARLTLVISSIIGATISILLGAMMSSTINWNDTHHVSFDMYTSYVFWDQNEYNAFPLYHPGNHLPILRPSPIGSISIGGAIVSTMFLTGILQAMQSVALSNQACCRNWAARRVSEGRNLCRWVDLGCSVPVSMIMVACLSGQTDAAMLGGTVALAVSAVLFWVVADEWVWVLWSIQRVHQSGMIINIHKQAIMGEPTCARRILPNMIGWIPFCASWGLVWIRFVQLSSGSKIGNPDHNIPSTTVPIVVVVFLCQCVIGFSQTIRHILTPAGNTSIISDVVTTLAVVVIKVSMAAGAMAIANGVA